MSLVITQEHKSEPRRIMSLDNRQKMVLKSLFNIEEVKRPKIKESVSAARNINKPLQLNISRNENKLPVLRRAKQTNTSSNEHSQLYFSCGTLNECSNSKVFYKKASMNVSQAEYTNSFSILSSEIKLPPILDKTFERTSDAQPSDHQTPPLIEKEVTDITNSKLTLENTATQPELNNPIREKLAEYRLQNPESRILQEEIETLNAIEHRNGLYIGTCDSEHKRHGYGVMFHTNGNIYDGEWNEDQKSGLGIQFDTSGDRYEGHFSNGKPHGKGTFKWSHGEFYDGEWENGFKNGFGIWKNNKGDFYKGDWKMGKAHGKGHQVWSKGDEYQGEFKDSVKHGHGEEKFANGDRYVGWFAKGHPWGHGEYYWSNGSIYKGQFINGLRHGHGHYINSNGEEFVGEFKEDLKNGFGEFKWASGNTYKGYYLNDVREGYGEVTWKDGSFYRGEWKQGIQHGIGELCLPGKCRLKGVFENNKFVREDIGRWREAKKSFPNVEKLSGLSKLTKSQSITPLGQPPARRTAVSPFVSRMKLATSKNFS